MTFNQNGDQYIVVPFPKQFEQVCEYWGVCPVGILEQFISDLAMLCSDDRESDDWQHRAPVSVRTDGLPPCLSRRDHKAARRYLFKVAHRYWCKL